MIFDIEFFRFDRASQIRSSFSDLSCFSNGGNCETSGRFFSLPNNISAFSYSPWSFLYLNSCFNWNFDFFAKFVEIRDLCIFVFILYLCIFCLCFILTYSPILILINNLLLTQSLSICIILLQVFSTFARSSAIERYLPHFPYDNLWNSLEFLNIFVIFVELRDMFP